MPPAPVEASQPQDSGALAGQTVSIVATMPYMGAPQVTDSLEKAIHMALDEAHSNVAGASVNYKGYDNSTFLDSILTDNPRQRGPMVLICSILQYDLNLQPGPGEEQFHL